jgi:parvulin-like peptidyl-prolyl isomerase
MRSASSPGHAVSRRILSLCVASAALAVLCSVERAPAQDNDPQRVAPPRALGGRQLGSQPTPPPPIEAIDDEGVAVVLNGERIDRAQYGEALIREYGLRYLETFVRQELVRQRAAQLGVTVPSGSIDTEVAQRIERILARRYRGSRPAMEGALASLGLTMEAWTRGMARRVRDELLTEALVRADRDVSEEALRTTYAKRYGSAGLRRTARQVVFYTNVWRSRLFTEEQYRGALDEITEEAQERASGLHALLAKGADLGSLARTHSEDAMAAKGGDYGPYWRNRYGGEIDRVIDRTPIGSVTPVLRTQRGFVIAQPYGVREAWELRARHILLSTRLEGRVSEGLREAKRAAARELAARLVERIRGGEDFAALASEHSHDPATRARGGDLGTVTSGQLDADLERALLALEPGALAGPVETSFGVHVLRLEAKQRQPERDERLVRVLLISTEFLKVKERRLAPTIEALSLGRAEEAAARLRGATPALLDGIVRELSEEPAAQQDGGRIASPLPPGTDPAVIESFGALTPDAPVAIARGKEAVYVLRLDAYDARSFAEAREALADEVRDAAVTPEEVRAYHERLRREADVQRGPMG